MPTTIDPQVIEAIRRLPPVGKQALLDWLHEELDRPDPEIERAWLAEIERRETEWRAGGCKTYSVRDIFGRDL